MKRAHPLDVAIRKRVPITEGGAAIDPNDVPRMSLAYFRPDVPEGMKVPTIMEIGPYFLEVTDDVESNVGSHAGMLVTASVKQEAAELDKIVRAAQEAQPLTGDAAQTWGAVPPGRSRAERHCVSKTNLLLRRPIDLV